MSVAKFFAGFVVGAAVGAVAGILLAPQSGEETRELIAEKSKDLKDKANEIMANLQEKGDELIEKVQKLVKKEENA